MANPPPNRRPGVDASIVQADTVRGYDAPSGAVPPQVPCDLIISTGQDQNDPNVVSDIILWNRTDDQQEPIFAMVPGALVTGARFNVHAGNLADPGGIVTAPIGSLYVSNNPATLWQNQDGGTTWKAISDELGGENLAETLAIGNFTGGTNIVVSNGDEIFGEANAVGAGFNLTLVGGPATGAVGAGGNVLVIGGSSMGGNTGQVQLLTQTAPATAASGAIVLQTATSTTGGGSGGISLTTGNVGAAGLGGNAGGILLSAGRSLATGLLSTGGPINLFAGQATTSGQGGPIQIRAGGSSAAFIPPPIPVAVAGQGGSVTIAAGVSSASQPGGNVILTAGAGGSGGATGGNINLNPGAGGGGFAAGRIIGNGVLVASNIKRGTGDPNGVFPGDEGDVYQRTGTGLGQLWLNTNGSINGWVRLAFAGDFIDSYEQLQWGFLTPAAKNPGGVLEDEYADVGLWKGLTRSTAGAPVGTITRGAALPNGPVLSFTVAAVGARAALDMSLPALGNSPHAIEHKFVSLFQAKPTGVNNFRAFMGFSTTTAANQLAAVNASPGAPEEYLGFVADPAQHGNWRVLTANGLGVSGPFDTGVSIIATQATSSSWFFLVDTSLFPSSVQFLIFDPSLALQGSVTVPTTLPNAGTPIGLIVGIQGTVGPAARTLHLNHATLVNQKGIVGEGGGSGLAGLTLAQVLINGNETGANPILINQGSFIQGVTDDNLGDGASFGVFGGATTFAGNDSGSVTVASGNRFGVAGTGDTGFLLLATGFQFDAGATGDTGLLTLTSGGHLGAGGQTGDLVIASGIHAGTGGTTGSVLIAPGTFVANPAIPGDLTLKGGSTSLLGTTGGDVTILSGESTSASGDTGNVEIETFDANIAGDGGDIILSTGEGGSGSGTSGDIILETGDAVSGSTGDLLLVTGDAGNGAGGQIILEVGDTTSGQGRPVILRAGDTSDGAQVGGNVEINPGTGPLGDGVVLVNGKLTVTGLIDPTGLLLNGQAAQPVPVGAGEGLLYVDNNAVPSRLFYVDDVGTSHDISTGGGATTLAALTDVNIAGPIAGQVLTYNGVQWQNLAGVGGSPLSTILAIGNTTGNLPIVVSNQPLARIVGEADLRLDPGPNPGEQVVIDGLRWPQADGLNGWVLTTDGLGGLSFQPGGGGGAETFAEAFARMQWGSLVTRTVGPPGSVDFNGIFNAVVEFSPGPSGTASTPEGVVASYTTAGIGIGSDAGIHQLSSPLFRPSRFLSVFHFDCPVPLGPPVDYRLFAGLADVPPPIVLTEPPLPINMIGIQLVTDAVPPQAVFNFVTNGVAAPTRMSTGISPAASTGFWLTVDTSTPGQITLTLYDANRVQLAQHVFVANLPLPIAPLTHMVVAESFDGAPKTVDVWEVGTVTRADLFAGIGGGGNQNLTSVLGFGNETGGIPIQGDDNVAGSGTDLDLLGGSSTGGLGSGGAINLQSGVPDPAGNGSGGDLQVLLASGAGTGAGGSFQVQLGDGGATNGVGGSFSIAMGDGMGSGMGGSFQVAAGDGGPTSGTPGDVQFAAGDATGGNATGGSFQVAAGSGFGTGDGGDVTLTAGAGGAGVGGDGGDIVLTPGAAGGGVVGTVEINGDAHVTGKLTVDGLIDPTGLLLNGQLVIPFAPAGNDGGLWVNNSGELVFTNALGDLNLSTAVGGGLDFLDGLLLAGYGFLGPGDAGGGPQSYGVYGSSINTAVSPGPPPASVVFGADVDGPFQNLAVGAAAGSEAWISCDERFIRRDQRFKAIFKFQVTSPAQTDQRLFVGFTDDPSLVTPSIQLAANDPVSRRYFGIRQDLAGFTWQFVARGSGGAMVPVFAAPTDALVHYIQLDASASTGDVTFTMLAADGITVEATHTEPASLLLPDLTTNLRPFTGIFTQTGTTPRGIDFYFSSVVTRADIIDAVTGGGGVGGIPTLDQVLAAGNATGANGIVFSSTSTGVSSDAAAPNSASDGTDIFFVLGFGSSEAGTGNAGGIGGDFQVTCGAGGATDAIANPGGMGGSFQVVAGPGGTNTGGQDGGAGGDLSFAGGGGGAATFGFGTGGGGGDFSVSSGGGGSALSGTGGAGGDLVLSAANGGPSGAGTGGRGGDVFVSSGDGAAGATGGDAGQIELRSGLGGVSGGLIGPIRILAGSAVATVVTGGDIEAIAAPDGLNLGGRLQLGPATALAGGLARFGGGNAGAGTGDAGGTTSIGSGNGDGGGGGGSITVIAGSSSTGAGGDVSVTTGAGATTGAFNVSTPNAAGGAGGGFAISLGNAGGGGSAAGGGFSCATGEGVIGGAGGDFEVATGMGGGTSGVGGSIQLATGGGGGTGNGGDFDVATGMGGGLGASGGDVTFTTGAGTGAGVGAGGDFSVSLGDGSGTGEGGNFLVACGDGGTGGGSGGDVAMAAGDGGVGGGGTGGAISFACGDGDGVGAGGSFNVAAGSGGGAGGDGGDVAIAAGSATFAGGDGGDVTLAAGTGIAPGVDGEIVLASRLDADSAGMKFGAVVIPAPGPTAFTWGVGPLAAYSPFAAPPRMFQVTLEAMAPGDFPAAAMTAFIVTGSVTAAAWTVDIFPPPAAFPVIVHFQAIL